MKGHLVAKFDLQRTQRVGSFHNPIVSVIMSWSVYTVIVAQRLWVAFEGISQGFPLV